MSHTGHFELSNFNLNFTILLENSKLWALTEGQHRPKAGEHRPKAGKKKKTHEVGLFFLVPASFQWCFITKWVNRLFPAQ